MCSVLDIGCINTCENMYYSPLLTELCPRGRWTAGHLNSFSRYGTDGIDWESDSIALSTGMDISR